MYDVLTPCACAGGVIAVVLCVCVSLCYCFICSSVDHGCPSMVLTESAEYNSWISLKLLCLKAMALFSSSVVTDIYDVLPVSYSYLHHVTDTVTYIMAVLLTFIVT